MADFIGASKQYADDVLGQSVISFTINGAGHLIGTRGNGSTFDAGDFTGIVTGILNSSVAASVATAVPNAVAGTTVERGDFSGTYDLTAQGMNNVNLINALIKIRLVGDIGFNSGSMVAGAKPNTMFAVRLQQDATGGRQVFFAGIKKSQGVITLTTVPNAVDVLVFLYDGTNWNCGIMGVDFK